MGNRNQSVTKILEPSAPLDPIYQTSQQNSTASSDIIAEPSAPLDPIYQNSIGAELIPVVIPVVINNSALPEILSFKNDILPTPYLNILNISRETIINYSAIDGDQFDSKLDDIEEYLYNCKCNIGFSCFANEIDELILLCNEKRNNSQESIDFFEDMVQMVRDTITNNK